MAYKSFQTREADLMLKTHWLIIAVHKNYAPF